MKFEFKKVICNSYLKKINDGKYIIAEKSGMGDLLECSFENSNNVDDSIDIEGYGEMLKTYYEIKNCNNFNGVIVGIKDIVLNSSLIVSNETDYYGKEFTRISKEPKEIVECGIVYFGNNRKRYVPLKHIEYVKE